MDANHFASGVIVWASEKREAITTEVKALPGEPAEGKRTYELDAFELADPKPSPSTEAEAS